LTKIEIYVKANTAFVSDRYLARSLILFYCPFSCHCRSVGTTEKGASDSL